MRTRRGLSVLDNKLHDVAGSHAVQPVQCVLDVVRSDFVQFVLGNKPHDVARSDPVYHDQCLSSRCGCLPHVAAICGQGSTQLLKAVKLLVLSSIHAECALLLPFVVCLRSVWTCMDVLSVYVIAVCQFAGAIVQFTAGFRHEIKVVSYCVLMSEMWCQWKWTQSPEVSGIINPVLFRAFIPLPLHTVPRWN